MTTIYPDPADVIFEISNVADGDNVYRVQVYVCDASMCMEEDYQTIRVTVAPNNTTLVPIVNYLLF